MNDSTTASEGSNPTPRGVVGQSPSGNAPSARTTGTSSVAAGNSAVATVTLTETATQEPETLTLTLQPRPTVRWDSDVVDNEGLGRKSSKRCCIFHKQRAFGESSTDSSDYESDGSASSSGDPNAKKPARKKKGAKQGKVPDHQRFHA
ncbi:Protein phosphatase 1 regulatory subunit 11 [Seminavis robusta]|uniref:Protein phosphatase 1 regulatory subunit 11 n=1 Tax=Seminavis robusta TaxID=568900 RepID=A0A9N8EDE0_9STRA|nr:Protein phosphatase 1 regulatory subunit 11 [Seminavis robusta]|eukprot:Sro961_g224930.1 Protein phosphatase 1 regulatory subunit 11 (148) ;mRNA; f:4345-4905